MNAIELLTVSEGLSWVTEQIQDLQENREDALQAAMFCSLANLVVAELIKHLTDGVEPHEALRRAAVGSVSVPDSTATVINLLAAKPTK